MQNHRIVEFGRDLWVHLVQPQLRQEQSEQCVQYHVHAVFGDLWGGDSTVSGKPLLVL